jgi:hypothetical protein
MQVPERLTHLSDLLIRQGRTIALNATHRESTASGEERVKLHHGVYMLRSHWDALVAEDRCLARILSVQHTAGSAHVFSHGSAAALLDLSLYGPAPSTAEVISSGRGGGVHSHGLTRHRAALPDEDVVSIGGILCTSPDRTLLDLARTGDPATSLSYADSYLRAEFRVDRRIDHERLGEWQEGMRRRMDQLRSHRGIRMARGVLALADPRKDSVLESVSHLRLHQLGFRTELQVPVPGPNGHDYYVDFEFVDLNMFGECDGRAKYTDSRMRGGLTLEQALYREKRRQDWICGKTRKGMVRWGRPDVDTTTAFARRLHAFGVPIPRPFATAESSGSRSK